MTEKQYEIKIIADMEIMRLKEENHALKLSLGVSLGCLALLVVMIVIFAAQ